MQTISKVQYSNPTNYGLACPVWSGPIRDGVESNPVRIALENYFQIELVLFLAGSDQINGRTFIFFHIFVV